ncbi:MAG: STAS domain-containing protein [Bryobacterales bacterium]|nr:STAS domain-containing protein [Bryobacterales bacterium]
MALQIEQRDVRPGVTVIALTGRVMLGGEGARIESLVEKGLKEGRRHFIFDLAGVTHIDSTGLGRFISGLNKARGAGGSLRMAAAAGQVRDAFHVTRLDTVFKFYDNVEAALEGLG